MRWTLSLLCLLMVSTTLWAGKEELDDPVQLMTGGKPLDVGGTGYAAPYVGDFNNDGVRDLIVGEFKQGRLRIYLNQGTDFEPQFGDFVWFKDDSPNGRVPAG